MMNLPVLHSITSILISAKSALAYLDPGTGSAILQGVLAALAAIAVVLKLYWHRFIKLFGLGKNKTDQQNLEKTKE